MTELLRDAGLESDGEVPDPEFVLLLDYLDGQLDEAGAAAFESRMEEDPEFFARVFPLAAVDALSARLMAPHAQAAQAAQIRQPVLRDGARSARRKLSYTARALLAAGFVALWIGGGAAVIGTIALEREWRARPQRLAGLAVTTDFWRASVALGGTAGEPVAIPEGLVSLEAGGRWTSGILIQFAGARDAGALDGTATLDLSRHGLLLRTARGEMRLAAGRYRVSADSVQTTVVRLDKTHDDVPRTNHSPNR